MLGPAYGVPSEAAKLAGYRNPSQVGSMLRKRLAKVLQVEQLRRETAEKGSPTELIALWWHYARNGDLVGHNNARSAQDALGKMYGLLNTEHRLVLDVDKLKADIAEALKRIKANPELVELNPAALLPPAPNAE